VSDLDTFTLRDVPRTAVAIDSNVQTDAAGAANAVFGMPTTLHGDAGVHANDTTHGLLARDAGDEGSVALGSFVLNTDGRGDAFALAGEDAGASDSMAFLDVEGRENAGALHFIMWSSAGVSVVADGMFVRGSRAGSIAVVPLPPAFALGLVGLGTLIAGRKLRKHARA
jgi:hypothetical protein